MLSKKALKRIDERNYLTEREHKEFLGIVKKDLDLVKELKKENQELKEKNSLIMKAVEGDVSNGELFKSMAMLLHKKIEEYKEAFKILKEEPYILLIGLENFTYDKSDNTYYYEEELYSQDLGYKNKLYVISKEKYDLLKEILGNE